MAIASYPSRRSPPPPSARLRAGVAAPHHGASRTSPRSLPPPLPPLRPVLTPELLATLRSMAPEPRRRRLPYVVVVALVVVGAVLSRDPAARGLVVAAIEKSAFVRVVSDPNVR
jgi:hypothetical protein